MSKQDATTKKCQPEKVNRQFIVSNMLNETHVKQQVPQPPGSPQHPQGPFVNFSGMALDRVLFVFAGLFVLCHLDANLPFSAAFSHFLAVRFKSRVLGSFAWYV